MWPTGEVLGALTGSQVFFFGALGDGARGIIYFPFLPFGII
jgi:hypothetical protein